MLTLAATALPALAEDACSTGQVRVVASSGQMESRICRAADTAIAAFAECGFVLPEPVTITVTEDVVEDCLAVFHCGEARIEILPLDRMQKVRRPDGAFSHVPVERLFDSAIVHELAHALYDAVECPYDLCLATSEYLAYTYQIASLPPQDRAPFQAAAKELGKVPRDAINVPILMFAPDRFALKSWAHLGQRADRCTFLQSVMSGVTVFDHYMP